MSHGPVALLLADMLERIQRVERHLAGLDRERFLADEKTCDAVVRNLEVIGEAASRLPGEFRDAHGAVPWRRITGLRNRVVHACFDVDLELVWQIAESELGALKAELERLRAQVAGDPPTG